MIPGIPETFVVHEEDPADIDPFREGRESVVPVMPVFQGLAALEAARPRGMRWGSWAPGYCILDLPAGSATRLRCMAQNPLKPSVPK